MNSSKKSFTIASLRRASYRWPARSQAANAAKVSRGVYTCNMCKQETRNKDKIVDHIAPVVDPVKGFIGFDDYVDRLFCDADGFQVLCKTCHAIKTKQENDLRKETKNVFYNRSKNERKKRKSDPTTTKLCAARRNRASRSSR